MVNVFILYNKCGIYYCYPLAACISSSINSEASVDHIDDEQPQQPVETTIVLKIQQNIGILFLLLTLKR